MSTGSEGAALDRRLKVVSDFNIPKQKQDAFSNSILDSILIANQVNKLYITGLDAGFCVNSTIEAALNRGYELTVISDAVISETDSLKVQVFKRLKTKGVTFLNSGEFPASVN
jgi:nicotinamidase-related amidase